MTVKEEEIANLQDVITRKIEEIEKKEEEVKNLRKDFDKNRTELEGKLEAEVKRVEEAKQSLEAERSRLREFNAKLVAVEEEKNTIARNHKEEIDKVSGHAEKMRKVLEEKEGELVKLGSNLNRAVLQIAAQAKEIESLNCKSAKELSELESRRKVAQDVDLKQAELAIKLAEVNKEKENFAMKMASVALINTKLNIREGVLATQRAEFEAVETHFDLLLLEERRKIRADIEAELDVRFKVVEPLEQMMATVVRREASVKEREEQCKYLLEEISERTAELVLSQEHTFVKRAEGMLYSVYNEFSNLPQAIIGKALVPIPSGSLDDAKKGEGVVEEGSRVVEGGSGGEKVVVEEKSAHKGEEEVDDEARAELARKKGKDIVVFEENRKPQSGKLLSASLAAHAIFAAHAQQQIVEDEAIPMALQQEFDLSRKGVTEIPLAKPLRAMPTQVVGPSSSSI